MEKLINNSINLEDFLKENGFELYTYYNSNKKYRKEITDCQNLYVRIYSISNTIQEVVYENVATTKFEENSVVSFDTVDTLPKLKSLLKSLK